MKRAWRVRQYVSNGKVRKCAGPMQAPHFGSGREKHRLPSGTSAWLARAQTGKCRRTVNACEPRALSKLASAALGRAYCAVDFARFGGGSVRHSCDGLRSKRTHLSNRLSGRARVVRCHPKHTTKKITTHKTPSLCFHPPYSEPASGWYNLLCTCLCVRVCV